MTFLDTGFLFALVSKRDVHHERAVDVFRSFQGLRLADHLLTTNHVIAETIRLTRKVGPQRRSGLVSALSRETGADPLGEP